MPNPTTPNELLQRVSALEALTASLDRAAIRRSDEVESLQRQLVKLAEKVSFLERDASSR